MIRLFHRTGILLIVALLFACRQASGPGVWMKLGGSTQGTYYSVTYFTADSTDYQEDLEKLLGDFDQSLSNYIDTSLISRFNRSNKGIIPDHYLETCFNCAREVTEATGGAFDITVAPLVNAWGFGFTEASEVDSALIDSLLNYVGMDKVRISGGEIRKDLPGVMLDVNAIAQGYAVDVLCGFLESRGIVNYLVDIGGELRTRGRNPDGSAWRVGIDRPVEGLQISGADLQAIVKVRDRSLATSGNYRKFYIRNGVKYAHTIDPKTGYPVQHRLLSASVMAEDCMRSDAYATAFMVMGFRKSREFLLDHPEMDAYLIYNDETGNYKVWFTRGMKKLILQGRD
jgi:thiamine biosynthesis lipoprotein